MKEGRILASKQLSMKNLGIDPADIKDDLSKYYKKVYENKNAVANAEMFYGSVEDYVNVLYWIKFVKKFDYHEMDSFTGRHHFYQVYTTNSFFWHYDADSLEECERLHQEELASLRSLCLKAKEYPYDQMPIQYKEAINTLRSQHNPRLLAKAKKYGHNSLEGFVKEVFYLRYIERLTTKEFAILYDENSRTANNLLSSLNCSITKEEAQQRVVSRGRRNYTKVFSTGRKTLAKSMLDSGLTGSKVENVARLLINEELNEQLKTERFEIIVGISNRGIIAPLEVDIPIIVIDKGTGFVKKYAVELNGTFWHNRRTIADNEKAHKLSILGWKYYAIPFHENTADITERFKLMVTDFSKKIVADVLKDIED